MCEWKEEWNSKSMEEKARDFGLRVEDFLVSACFRSSVEGLGCREPTKVLALIAWSPRIGPMRHCMCNWLSRSAILGAESVTPEVP